MNVFDREMQLFNFRKCFDEDEHNQKENKNMAEAGRPTKYKPEYDDEIIQIASSDEITNFYLIAAKWGVCRDTLYEWCDVHESFSDAYVRAGDILLGKLIAKTEEGMNDRNFNSNAANIVITQKSRRRRKMKGLSSGTLNQRVTVILQNVESGNLEEDAALTLTQVVSLAAKIDDSTEARADMEKHEREGAVIQAMHDDMMSLGQDAYLFKLNSEVDKARDEQQK